MDEFGFEGGVDIQETPNPQDLKQFGTSSAVFDASQYAFFGDNVSEEVELGGLEDEEDYYPPVDYDDEEFLFNEELPLPWLTWVFLMLGDNLGSSIVCCKTLMNARVKL